MQVNTARPLFGVDATRDRGCRRRRKPPIPKARGSVCLSATLKSFGILSLIPVLFQVLCPRVCRRSAAELTPIARGRGSRFAARSYYPIKPLSIAYLAASILLLQPSLR